MAKLTVDGNTRLADLAKLTQNAADSNKTLRAKHNSQGDVVLYVKGGKSAFLDKITGRAERRQERAADVVRTLFVIETNAMKDIKIGVGHLERYAQSSIAQKLRAGDVRAIASNAGRVLDMLPARLARPDLRPEVAGPSLGDLGLRADGEPRRAADDLARALQQNSTGKSFEDLSAPFADALGDGIATVFKNKPGTGQEDWNSFGRSGALKLREELKGAFTNTLATIDERQLETFVDRAVNRAVSQMLQDQVVPDTLKTVAGDKLPNVKIGDHEFTPTKLLGAGGFGKAFEYVNVSNPSEKIALKLPLVAEGDSATQRAEKTADFAKEAVMHKSAQGEGSKHVLGIKSDIRFPDGRLAIAMEIAPHGDAQQLSDLVRDKVKDGSLSNDVANLLRLTMIQDMALGLQHLADQNVLHLDFKAPNCFVGEDGTIKVADFGGSKNSRYADTADMAPVRNPYWLAPEVVAGRQDIEIVTALGNPELQEARNQAKATIKDLLPNATDDTLIKLSRTVVQPKADEWAAVGDSLSRIRFLDGAADVWGLGSSALEMFTGKLAAERVFKSDTEALLGKFAGSGELPLIDQRAIGVHRGVVGLKTGDGGIDALLTGLLQSKPEARSKPVDVLASQVFDRPGVGSTEAKALLVAIKSGNDDKIRNALDALQNIAA
jgi:serine/threonine protein kinase